MPEDKNVSARECAFASQLHLMICKAHQEQGNMQYKQIDRMYDTITITTWSGRQYKMIVTEIE